MRMQKQSKTYEEFVEKFKRKKTTDDCYTPPEIYEAVKDWAIDKYGLHGREIIRPFWPETDYQTMEYPEGCVVIDNPPFSILTKIVRWYEERGIDYFLFAPHLTLFSINAGRSNYVVTDTHIEYENGARVPTGFVTNLGSGKIILSQTLKNKIDKEAQRVSTKVKQKKYCHPSNVVSAALLKKYVCGCEDEDIAIASNECEFIRKCDNEKQGLFGAGFLVSDRTVKILKEKALDGAIKRLKEKEQEPIYDNKYGLSEREKKIIEKLNINSGQTV